MNTQGMIKVGTYQRQRPALSYKQAANRLSGQDKNLWIKQSTEGNENRVLMVQFSSKLLSDVTFESKEAVQYYDSVYKNVPSYKREEDFWEVPVWVTHLANTFPNSDVYIVRNMKEAEDFLSTAGYSGVFFSALDVNADLIKQLAQKFPGPVYVGGYVRKDTFVDVPNIRWFDSIAEVANELGAVYQEGPDYRHFAGTETIPRICMSTGCLYDCAFCTIPKKVKPVAKDKIDEEVEAIVANLDSDLMYLNDKTFGQSPNYTYLEELYKRIKKLRPTFNGFIVQTTASQLLKIPDEFLKNAGIQVVEIGVESFNDKILRSIKKPHTEAQIEAAAQKLRDNNIWFVPNVLIGLPGETAETYGRTLDFLQRNQDIISHMNIYNLALYEGTQMKDMLGVQNVNALDVSEGAVEKSWYKNPDVHKKFASDVYALAQEIVKRHKGSK